jgi:hypothetical protein
LAQTVLSGFAGCPEWGMAERIRQSVNPENFFAAFYRKGSGRQKSPKNRSCPTDAALTTSASNACPEHDPF